VSLSSAIHRLWGSENGKPADAEDVATTGTAYAAASMSLSRVPRPEKSGAIASVEVNERQASFAEIEW
jgi:hypothetical protein